MKRVILITGTPCVGKTTVAEALAAKLQAQYINLTDYAKTNNLTLGEDTERHTIIIDEEAMEQKLAETIEATKSDVVVDGHYAAAVTPPNQVTHVFVLRRNPKELKAQMQKCSWPDSKVSENLSAEILDNCLVEALETQEGKVCELDISGKPVEETLSMIIDVVENRKKCFSGFVDWLGLLEHEGILDEYLKV